METRDVRGVPVEIHGAGSGPPLLYLHAEQYFEQVRPYLDALAKKWTVIAPRHTGYGAEDKVIAWSAGGNDRKIKGNDYVQQFALPNFFFFVTTAYDILRHRGVPLGKRDFLGPVTGSRGRYRKHRCELSSRTPRS